MANANQITPNATLVETNVDAISSVLSRTGLSAPLTVGPQEKPNYGQVVVARVKSINPSYPVLETTGGAGIRLHEGMIIAGALGARKALHGFSGQLPKSLGPYSPLHLLNKGGVMGECTAFHRSLGWPAELEYLGTAYRKNQFLSLKQDSLSFYSHPLPETPIILVLGTCMNSGKTAVCKQVLRLFTHKGFSVNAGKVAGVAAGADLEAMRESGATKVLSFNDLGLPSTVHLSSLSKITCSLVHHLSDPRPDFALLEAGDGILGGYQVGSLFQDQQLLDKVLCVILCANDLMGTWGALEWLRQQGHEAQDLSLLVSGPVTDSAEGIFYIENNFAVAAANAFESSGKLGTFILERLIPWSKSA